MKAQKLPSAFLLLCFLLTCFIFMNHQHAAVKLPAAANATAATGGLVQHVVVFDAGSTGTRFLVFRFQLGTKGAVNGK